MEPVDICAILANQIDNAFEACQRIAEETERIVSVHIWCQTESIVFFQASNRVLNNPFESNPELKSAKQDHLRPHGLGIKSIKKLQQSMKVYWKIFIRTGISYLLFFSISTIRGIEFIPVINLSEETMLTYYAIKLTNQIYKHCSLSSEKRSIYVYGFELFLSTMLSVVSVLLFALFFSAPETGLIFLFVFMGLRLFSGGYHAKTYGHCFILTNAIFLLVLFCSWELVRAATETAAVIIAIKETFCGIFYFQRDYILRRDFFSSVSV